MDKHHFCFSLLLFIARAVDSQLFLGDTCVHIVSGQDGICTLFQDCPSDQEDFRRGKPAQICDFFGRKPIVCCVESSSSETATTSTTTTTTTTRRQTTVSPTSKTHAFNGLPDETVIWS